MQHCKIPSRRITLSCRLRPNKQAVSLTVCPAHFVVDVTLCGVARSPEHPCMLSTNGRTASKQQQYSA
jgi:hypothetical protein